MRAEIIMDVPVGKPPQCIHCQRNTLLSNLEHELKPLRTEARGGSVAFVHSNNAFHNLVLQLLMLVDIFNLDRRLLRPE